jgi:hypothetical protein
MNANTITNGPAASRGVYVGTIATDGSTQLNMQFEPAAAAGGTANRLDVWNAYNRVPVKAMSRDSTNSWTYNSATWRAANAAGTGSGLLNRVTAVFGLNEEIARVLARLFADTSNGMALQVGVGVDSITAFSGLPGSHGRSESGSSSIGSADGNYSGQPGLGQHYFQMLESSASGTITIYGDNNAPTVIQSGLILETRM